MQGGVVNVSGRLFINNQGTIMMSGGIVNVCTNSLSNSANASFEVTATSNINTINGGTIVFQNPNSGTGGDLLITSGTGTKTITGGTFQIGNASTPAGSTFLVNSSIPIYNFTINNTNTPSVRLTNNLTINNQLTLNGGNLNAFTNSKTVIISSTATAAIVRTTGFVLGNLQRAIIGTGSATYNYPIGTGANYTPVDISFNNITSPGNLTVFANVPDHPNINSSAINTSESVNAYWTLINSGFNFNNYSATFSYPSSLVDGTLGVGSGSKFIVGKYNSGWTYPPLTGTPTLTGTSITGTTLSGTNSFAIGNCTPPTITLVTTNATVCQGTTSANLPYSSTTGNPDVYSISYSAAAISAGFVNVTNAPLPSSPIALIVPAAASGTTYNATLIVTISASGCVSNTIPITITVNPTPTAIAPPNQIYCNGVATSAIAITGSPLGVAFDISGGVSVGLANQTGVTSIPIFTPIAGSATITITPRANGCTGTAITYAITVSALPTTSNAGPDQTGASTCGLTTVTLAANTPAVGTGTWSIISGTGGSFGNTSSPTSTFSGVAGNTYTLRWTIINAPCTASTDDVDIKFNQNPTTSNAGPDQTGTSTCGLTSVTLAANTPTIGTGSWSIVSGSGGTVTTPSNPSSTFSGVAGNTYTLRWTISNSPCTASTDDVVITFNTFPVITLNPVSQTICKNSSVTFTASSSGVPAPTVRWQLSINNGGTWTDIPGATNQILTLPTVSSTDDKNQYRAVWTNLCGTATTSAAILTVQASLAPSTIASNQSGCAGGNVTFSASSVGGGNGIVSVWQVSTNGGFTWTDIPGTDSTHNGTFTTYYTVTGTSTPQNGYVYRVRYTATCGNAFSVADTLTVTTPLISGGGPNNVCQSATPTVITLSGSSFSGGPTTAAWSITSGGGTLNNTSQTAKPDTVKYTPAANFTGTVTLTLTSNNAAACGVVVTTTRTITVNPSATATAGPLQTVCAGGTITLAGTIGGSATTSTWSASSGTFSNASSLTSTYTPSITTGTVTLTLTTNDPDGAGPCTAAVSTVVITVSPSATATAGPVQTVCAGGTITLAGTIGGSATTSTWSAPSGTFSNASSLTSTYTPSITTGTVTLTLTTNDPDGAGPCTAATSTVIITVNPKPSPIITHN